MTREHCVHSKILRITLNIASKNNNNEILQYFFILKFLETYQRKHQNELMKNYATI